MMRAYHPFPVPAEAETLTLSREESFHLVKVLRVRADEKITAFGSRSPSNRGNAVSRPPARSRSRRCFRKVRSPTTFSARRSKSESRNFIRFSAFFKEISAAPDAAGTLRLTASLEADSRSCREIEASCRGNAPRKILWLVGPEGDLSPEEYAAARACNFLPARLGRFVLRVPTAAAYCLAAGDQMRANLI